MRHPADRLAALPDAAFAAVAERLGGVWPGYETTVSPVSPAGTVELSLVRDGDPSAAGADRGVVRLCRADVDVDDVNDFAVFVAERGLSVAVLATVGAVESPAARRARAAPLELYDGAALVTLARDAGVALVDGDGTGAAGGDDHDREPGPGA